jgi:hypothetical protein
MNSVIRATGARLMGFAAVLLACAPTTGAREPQSALTSPQSTIVVHGHWTIAVRDSDGALVKRHEFYNALQDPRNLLTAVARQGSIGYWVVDLYDVHGVGSPCLTSATPAVPTTCTLQEPGDANAFGNSKRLPVLSVALAGSPVPTGLVLQGTFTADVAGQISGVSTRASVCPTSIAPASPCANGTPAILTSHFMAVSGPPPVGPIPVTAGQVVQVRVEISFSSAPTT